MTPPPATGRAGLSGPGDHDLPIRPGLKAVVCLAAVLPLCLLWSCGERTADMDKQMFSAHTVSEEVLIQGREAYMLYCVGCHGEKGDGKGPAAEFLEPKPRDFTRGIYKFVSTSAGDLARDEDLLRTINRGLHGSSMPAWNLIDRQTQAALVAYLKSFSDFYAEGEQGDALPVPPDPWKFDPAGGMARGRLVYHGLATCYKCHPAYVNQEEIKQAARAMKAPVPESFPEDLYAEKIKRSETFNLDIRPPDFTRRQLRTGNQLEDLIRVIQSGVGGTAMPTWAGVLDPSDLWAMAHYVRGLTELRNTPAGDSLRQSLGIR
jgi:mono/diheme cytochrome c family protein